MGETERKLSTCLFGFIDGPLRLETLGGADIYVENPSQLILFIPPILIGKQRFVSTHLQKRSRFGVLLTWPFGFHVWFMWKLQDQDENGGAVPGSEEGPYARTPGWRWDCDLGMKWTWGFIGLHWD
jgi:hypothetical protein